MLGVELICPDILLLQQHRLRCEWIDRLYPGALRLGAKGGKVVCAGGGGFLLLVAEPEKHEVIAKGLGLVKTDFKFSHSRSRVIFVGD